MLWPLGWPPAYSRPWSDPLRLDQSRHRPVLKVVDAVQLIAPISVADAVPLVEPLLHEAVELGARRIVLLSSSAVTDQTPCLGAPPRLARPLSPE